MKLFGKKVLWIVGIFCISANVFAATVSSDTGIEILALDGQEIESGRYVEKVLDVSEGKHQLVWRYYGYVRDGGKTAIYSTAPYIATVKLTSDESIKILAPKLSTRSQAKAYFRRDVDWQVQYQDGTVKSLNYESLIGNGLMPFTDIEKAVAYHNQKQGNEFAPQPETQSATPAIASQKLHVQKADDTLVQTIQLLYNNATAAQKQKIKAWIAQQP